MKTKTKKLLLDSILGAGSGLFCYKLYPQGITDIRWWIGVAWLNILIFGYNSLSNQLSEQEMKEKYDKDKDDQFS
jgi:hypothetical protein